jgi:hypothetical protein
MDSVGQNPIEWLESKVKSMIMNGGDLGEDYPALLKQIETAKEKQSEMFNLLSDFEIWKEWKNNNFIIVNLTKNNEQNL